MPTNNVKRFTGNDDACRSGTLHGTAARCHAAFMMPLRALLWRR